ncbi:ribonuclease J [Aliiglaciecola lipolytica]|uniref:Metallo-beta-lactamase family protein n=1 Tax=Aliiglaciecola lipolytica E3 TaxID=1127673 RepID=K6Z0J8_9ALTE|nr:ribonuclease J [Aliiglaciecola lipolytica]GAC16980.1 metallo-beta-lactamase family protein [Aliiglaciecola lipolytica E3]
MNLNLYGHNGQWLMVDCGVTFDEALTVKDGVSIGQKHDVVCADPTFISRQKENLIGIVITHAHEDHIGALPYLWQRFKCPVYTTAYTAEILRRKLQNSGNQNMPIVEVISEQTVDMGHFNVQWMPITHSIPEPHGLLIRTEAGTVFHTADWKIDASPVTGKKFSEQSFKALRKQNVLAMVCDSTNATRSGFSVSEGKCYEGLKQLIDNAPGRVVVGCFSSNIARLITLAKIAKQSGRYLALLGRSLQNTVGAAKATGHWPDDLAIIDSYHSGYLPPSEVLAIATGSQGESRAALYQLAQDSYRDLSLDNGDLVIFSSIIIPGNEKAVDTLLKAFKARNINTILSADTEKPIHASGHPCEEELKLMYNWVRPQVAVPTHGEDMHMQRNAYLAKQSNVPRALTGNNGDIFMLAPQLGVKRQAVKTGRIALSNN